MTSWTMSSCHYLLLLCFIAAMQIRTIKYLPKLRSSLLKWNMLFLTSLYFKQQYYLIFTRDGHIYHLLVRWIPYPKNTLACRKGCTNYLIFLARYLFYRNWSLTAYKLIGKITNLHLSLRLCASILLPLTKVPTATMLLLSILI